MFYLFLFTTFSFYKNYCRVSEKMPHAANRPSVIIHKWERTIKGKNRRRYPSVPYDRSKWSRAHNEREKNLRIKTLNVRENRFLFAVFFSIVVIFISKNTFNFALTLFFKSCQEEFCFFIYFSWLIRFSSMYACVCTVIMNLALSPVAVDFSLSFLLFCSILVNVIFLFVRTFVGPRLFDPSVYLVYASL